jgi:hypothetical protein
LLSEAEAWHARLWLTLDTAEVEKLLLARAEYKAVPAPDALKQFIDESGERHIRFP